MFWSALLLLALITASITVAYKLLKEQTKPDLLLVFITTVLSLFVFVFIASLVLLLARVYSLGSLTILCLIMSVLAVATSYNDLRQGLIKWITSITISKLDIVAILISVVVVILISRNIAEWYVGGGMDAGNYIAIAYDFINRGTFFKELSTDSEHFVCLSTYTCIDTIGKPMFVHFFPILLAAGGLLSPLYGMPIMHLIIAFVTLISFYSLIKYILGDKLAVGGLLLMCFIPINVLYLKETMSETLGQFFLFSGVLYSLLGYKQNRQKLLIWGGWAFAALLVTKVDSVLIVFPLLTFIVFTLAQDKIRLLRYAYLIFVGVALYYVLLSHRYTIYANSKLLRGSNVILPLIIPLSLFFLNKIDSSKLATLKNLLHSTALKKVLLLVFTIIFSFIFYRNLSGVIDLEQIKVAGGNTFNEVNILRLMYFISPVLIITAAIGSLVALKKSKMPYTILLFGVIFPALINLFNSYHSQHLYWWSRRYLLFTIPLVILGCLYVIQLLQQKFKN